MKISFATAERRTQEALEWYWHQSMSDIGIQSNWCAMIQEASVSKVKHNQIKSSIIDYYSDKQMQAVNRRREIEKIFFKLSEQQRNVLYARFGWILRTDPGEEEHLDLVLSQLRSSFGEYAPIVCHLHPNWFQKKQKNKKFIYLEEARMLYREAIIAFHEKYLEQQKAKLRIVL
jgi:hypothetical protein